MTKAELIEALNYFPDDARINFECSCSRKGGYDGWKVQLSPRGNDIDFYLDGYHDES